MSYLHVEWVSSERVEAEGARGRAKIQRFLKQQHKKELAGNLDVDDDLPFPPEYAVAERILDEQDVPDPASGEDSTRKQYFVKWQGLPYSESTWENAEDIQEDDLIQQFHRFNTVPSKAELRQKPKPKPKVFTASIINASITCTRHGGH